jgi:hypothetical protein
LFSRHDFHLDRTTLLGPNREPGMWRWKGMLTKEQRARGETEKMIA